MNQLPNRRKLRHIYLRKRGTALLKMLAWTCVMLPTAAFALLLGGIFVAGLFQPLMLTRSEFFVVPTVDLVLWLLTWWSVRAIIRTEARVDALPYLPPVSRADLLPAEKVLVRGSDEPTGAQSETLLRAAKRQETPTEELLRVSQE